MGNERILLVDNDPIVSDGVADVLSAEGYHLTMVSNSTEALDAIRDIRPDIILLEIVLPGLSVIDLCKSIRSSCNVPIIIVSDQADEENKVAAFDCGVDDYITKPFLVRELISRIRAVLRRTKMSLDNVTTHIVQAEGIRLDTLKRIVIVRGEEVELTPKEYELLRRLMCHPNHVIERHVLFNDVWGKESQACERTLDVHIRWLRQKIEENPDKPRLIMTARGIGYRFAINQNPAL